jgi:replicative DNA helicase
MTNKLFREDSEYGLFNIIFRNPDYVYEVLDLSPEMFSSEPNKIIYSSLVDLTRQNLTIEKELLLEILSSKNKLDRVGGKEYIDFLYGLEYDKNNFTEYKNLVVNSFKARHLLSISANLPEQINNGGNVDMVLSDLRTQLDGLVTLNGVTGTKKISDVLGDAWTKYKSKIENPGLAGVTTGYQNLDNVTGGYKPGDLWVVGGRPSMGKSSWVCNSILESSLSGAKSLLFSLEMNYQALVERLASVISGVDLNKISLGLVESEQENNKVREAWNQLHDLELYLDANFSTINPNYISSVIRKYVSQYGIDFVWVDYIHLLAERSADATHELGRISREMKLLAEELSIAIGLVVQLNRRLEQRDDKRPILSDIRQSGNLEEDADLVAFVYRDEKYYSDSKDKGKMEFIIRKHRNGPIGTLRYDFVEHTTKVS